MNENIVIVGASDGIGRACAEIFLKNNNRVYNISRTACDLDGVENFCADVTRVEELTSAFDDLKDKIDKADVFMYFAGYSMAAPAEYASEADYRYLFDVNLFSLMHSVQLVLPLMKGHGGKIVFASSIGGTLPILYDAFYTASKAAVDAYAAELDMELTVYGISVTAALIGGTSTCFTFKRNVYPDEKCGDYADCVKRSASILGGIEQRGASPKSVAKKLVKLTSTASPPSSTAVGFINKIVVGMRRFLPQKFTSSLIRSMQSRRRF